MHNEARDVAVTFVKMLCAVDLRKATFETEDGTRPGDALTTELRRVVTFNRDEKDVRDHVARCRGDGCRLTEATDQLANAFETEPALPGKLWTAAEAWAGTDWPRPFWLVLRDEMKEIASRRSSENPDAVDREPNIYKAVADTGLVALAFSGGGIRSATFNLGVLQALAQFGILPRIDYLSTVSGGGYIGAWLSALIQRNRNLAAVQEGLSPEISKHPKDLSQKPIRFLRQFSNYLTPALGLFSFDTWTMAAVYLRNVLLNQLILVAGFGALLIVPRLFGVFLSFETGWPKLIEWIIVGISVALGLTSVVFFSRYLGTVTRKAEPGQEPARAALGDDQKKPVGSPRINLFCVWPLLLAVLIASQIFWKHLESPVLQSLTEPRFLIVSIVALSVLSLFISLFGGFVHCFRQRLAKPQDWQLYGLLALVTLLSAAAGTGLLRCYVLMMQFFHALGDSGLWHAAIWGPPALLLVLSLSTILQMGLMGVDFPDAGREWLSRYRAVMSIYMFFWLALFCASIYGPWLVAKLGIWVTGLGAAWIGTTVASLWAGKGSQSGQTKEGEPTFSKLDLLAKIGPPVFLVGFVLAVSVGVNLLLAHALTIGYSWPMLLCTHWDVLNLPINATSALWNGGDWVVAAPLTLFLLLAFVALVLAWRVDINEFSMHHFYKNRLVRCYLGASHTDRKPDIFTGFDPNDDLPIAALKPSLPERPYQGPYHIINATLNISAGGQLAWQERQAASFIFSPCYSGFNLSFDSDHPEGEGHGHNLKFCAYRKTDHYAYTDGIKLGTAIAVSGAAADPNQGFNTSPAVAFLMTIFDVRLGWWLGNPRKDRESKLSSPRFGLAALISELFGQTDDRTNFVSLSDGGHFDNMGIYELVRRRCKYIILCDAEQDATFTFGGLGMAIRKCRIDFGAEIEIDPKRIAPVGTTHRSDSHCAVGKITYADGEKGVLVYIKSSLTGDEPEDVLQYAAGKAVFPHESTADQWFSESQFESYRKLGYHAALSAFKPAGNWIDWKPAATLTDQLFDALSDYWYPLNPALRDHATKHTRTLNDLLDKMRANEDLHDLGSKLFPGASFVPKTANPAAEYFFCMMLIQLVEDVYVDFQLDSSQWHDDPRIGGWMRIFKNWSKVSRMIETWDVGKKTFRKDFQQFWENLTPRPSEDSSLHRYVPPVDHPS